MKIKKYKLRVCISIVAFFLSIALILFVIILSQKGYIWVGIAGSIASALLFTLFLIMMPKTNADGSPIVIKKKIKRKTKHKVIKSKKSFISKDEWNKEETEDDEMMFIEEIVEDD